MATKTVDCKYRFSLRSRAGVSFSDFSATVDATKTKIENAKVSELEDQRISCTVAPDHALYSPDGSIYAAATEKGIIVRSDTDDKTMPPLSLFLPCTKIVKMAFSPLSTYLVTWERQKAKDAPNLFVWAMKNAENRNTTPEAPSAPVASFMRKIDANHNLSWPLLAWSSDEHFCAHMCSECVEILPGEFTGKIAPVMRIPAHNVDHMDWCPVAGPRVTVTFKYLLAIFCLPRGTAQAGFVGIYEVDPEKYPFGTKKSIVPLSERSFMQADSCVLKWNPAAGRGQPQALLAMVCTESDATGMTYYGASTLYILFADKPHMNGLVPLRKQGNIHDIAWAPNGKLFAIVYGYMPAMTSVYEMMPNGRSFARGDLGPLSRNVARFSPDSRILFIGGFGNLSGDMDFFDTKDFSVLGRANAHTTTQWEWSPDSMFLSCGVTAPRRHIDNGFHVFAVNGQLVYSQEVPELYDFQWKPNEPMVRASLENEPIRPLPPADRDARITIPRGSSSSVDPAAAAGASAASASAAAPAPTTMPKGKYIPPHLRHAAAAAAAAPQQTQKPAPQPKPDMTVYNRDGSVSQQQPQQQQRKGGQNKNKNKKRHDKNMQLARREY